MPGYFARRRRRDDGDAGRRLRTRPGSSRAWRRHCTDRAACKVSVDVTETPVLVAGQREAMIRRRSTPPSSPRLRRASPPALHAGRRVAPRGLQPGRGFGVRRGREHAPASAGRRSRRGAVAPPSPAPVPLLDEVLPLELPAPLLVLLLPLPPPLLLPPLLLPLPPLPLLPLASGGDASGPTTPASSETPYSYAPMSMAGPTTLRATSLSGWTYSNTGDRDCEPALPGEVPLSMQAEVPRSVTS